MALTTARLDTIVLELLGLRTPRRADTPAEAVVRAALKKDIDAITAKGGVVDLPADLPDAGD